MSDYLCLRFRESEINPQAALSWVMLSATAEVLASGECLLANITSSIPEHDHSLRVIVLVPASSLLLTSAEIASKQRRHIRQVLPFIVEEQLIDPVESMHLATPVLFGDENIPVAAVRRNVLASWLDQLSDYDLYPDYLFADACCVPSTQGQWQLLLEDKTLLFKQSEHSGLSLAYDMAEPVLRLAIAKTPQQYEAGDAQPGSEGGDENHGLQNGTQKGAPMVAAELSDQAPDPSSAEVALITINASDFAALRQLHSERDSAASIEGDEQHSIDGDNSLSAAEPSNAGDYVADAEVDTWQVKLDDFIRSENRLTRQIRYSETATELLAVNAVKTVDQQLNLLQGDFRPANANAENQRFIYRVGFGVAACLAFFLLVSLGGGFYLNYRADRYFDQSVAIYRDLFPKQRRVIDPVKQMKRQLKGQTVGGTTSEFLPLLDAASKSLASLEEQSNVGASIKQLRYDIQRGNISIDIHATNIDDLETYKDLLAAEGLNVDILSANQDGETVKGRLQIGRS